MRFFGVQKSHHILRFLDDKIELQNRAPKASFGSKSSSKIELREIWCWMKNRASKSSSKIWFFEWKKDHFLSVCLKSSKNPVQQGRKSGCWTENHVFRRKTVKKPSKIDHFLNFFEKSSKIHHFHAIWYQKHPYKPKKKSWFFWFFLIV